MDSQCTQKFECENFTSHNNSGVAETGHFKTSQYKDIYCLVSTKGTVSIGIASGSGTISRNSVTGYYDEYYTVTATPSPGYYLTTWNYNVGNHGNRTNPLTLRICSQQNLRANFGKETYTINFNANGGSVGTTSKTVWYGDVFNLPTPTRTGYIFNGWSYNGSTYSAGQSYTVPDLGSNGTTVTFTASWRVKTFPIKYLYGYDKNGNGNLNDDFCGDGGTIEFGSTIGLLKEQTRDGYVFLNWLCNKDSKEYGEGVSYTPGDYPEDPNDPITFTAQWRSKKYNVYYNDGKGGEDEYDKIIYYEDGTYRLRDGPPQTGFTFDGWLCSADSKVYGSGATYNIPPNLEDDADITFTAQRKENTYNLVYNNSLNGDTKTYKLKYTESHSIIDNPFNNPNYYFKGWATTKEKAEAGTVDYVPNAQVDRLREFEGESFNLYAVWVETWASKFNSDQYKPDGKGEKDNPYLIASEENLAWVASQNNSFNGQYFKQITNLDFSSYYWLPIGRQSDFGGIYNGNGFEITNIKTPENAYDSIYVGLICDANGANIEKIHLKNCTFNVNNTGLLAGSIIGNTTGMVGIKNCIVENCSIIGGYPPGHGMICAGTGGQAIISNCLVMDISTPNYSPGISLCPPWIASTITNCLYECNGVRNSTDINSFDLSAWGKVGNNLLPKEFSWLAGVSSITKDDITAWLNKELGE